MWSLLQELVCWNVGLSADIPLVSFWTAEFLSFALEDDNDGRTVVQSVPYCVRCQFLDCIDSLSHIWINKLEDKWKTIIACNIIYYFPISCHDDSMDDGFPWLRYENSSLEFWLVATDKNCIEASRMLRHEEYNPFWNMEFVCIIMDIVCLILSLMERSTWSNYFNMHEGVAKE